MNIRTTQLASPRTFRANRSVDLLLAPLSEMFCKQNHRSLTGHVGSWVVGEITAFGRILAGGDDGADASGAGFFTGVPFAGTFAMPNLSVKFLMGFQLWCSQQSKQTPSCIRYCAGVIIFHTQKRLFESVLTLQQGKAHKCSSASVCGM